MGASNAPDQQHHQSPLHRGHHARHGSHGCRSSGKCIPVPGTCRPPRSHRAHLCAPEHCIVTGARALSQPGAAGPVGGSQVVGRAEGAGGHTAAVVDTTGGEVGATIAVGQTHTGLWFVCVVRTPQNEYTPHSEY